MAQENIYTNPEQPERFRKISYWDTRIHNADLNNYEGWLVATYGSTNESAIGKWRKEKLDEIKRRREFAILEDDGTITMSSYNDFLNTDVSEGLQYDELVIGEKDTPFDLTAKENSGTTQSAYRATSCVLNMSDTCIPGTQEIAYLTGSPTIVSEGVRAIGSVESLQYDWINADVKAAWAGGWTGKGINIAVADDFAVDEPSETFAGSRDATVDGKDATLRTIVQIPHGRIVEMIAAGHHVIGGDWTIRSDNYDVSCGDNTCSRYITAQGQFANGPILGIAEGATTSRLDFLTNQSYLDMSDTGSALDLRGYDIFNMSFGVSGTTENQYVYDYFKNTFDHTETLDSTKGTLIVKSAGNDSEPTHNGRINNALIDSEYEDSTLIVGATVSETNNALASYSNTAGTLKGNFVVDAGTSFLNSVNGTSFAAPRVSGKAALVMHKFDNINAVQTADIIKSTADDLGAVGVDDVFGHGKVNLGRALSPIGDLN